ncbi:hypothetical protein ACJYYY_07155 [Brochothrix campestris]|uniref:hypothetical protein n=1 Tax=Brochothrix campestris TaxID=2757 RepID=UPI0038CF7EB0
MNEFIRLVILAAMFAAQYLLSMNRHLFMSFIIPAIFFVMVTIGLYMGELNWIMYIVFLIVAAILFTEEARSGRKKYNDKIKSELNKMKSKDLL